ncbi:Peptidyl-prolyl cis-trans isomerase [Plasmodiophora brassicae]
MSVLLETSLGDIVIDLHADDCPATCKNFLKLCKVKYYNGCVFHKVERGFIAQTGDPTGTGRGGDSLFGVLYGQQARFFDDEIRPHLTHNKKGTVAMASSGPNLNASLFYITLADDLDYLDGQHTVFGEVAEGIDLLDKLGDVFVDEQHRPLKNIRIRHTVILDDPFPDPATLVVPDQSPVRTRDAQDLDYIAEDEDLDADQNAGKTEAELEETIAQKEERNRAELLEMIGDLPTADFIPPDNVLFVCKLNPVTRSEDLELIFSRFGNIKKCEVIRDYKTNDSLQYAFIEFETDKECEEAYKKMENVLIDDRRIHVDFSQSVYGVWNKWKRGDKMERLDKSSGLALKDRHQGPDANYQMVFDHDHMRSNRRPALSPPTHKRPRSRSPHRHHHRRSRSPRRHDHDRHRRHR